MRQHISQDAVRILCNKDRMAVEPILQLASTAFTAFLDVLGPVSHTLVPERLKWTDNNKVGMFPHPVDVATNGNGYLYMLDFDDECSESRLVELQLHIPVRTKSVLSGLHDSKSLCVHKEVVFVAASDGLIFAHVK